MENLKTQTNETPLNSEAKREELAQKLAHIKGWGIDIDPKNDPTYPIKNPRTDVEQQGYSWERPVQQPVTVEILHSNERPGVSAVFGTTAPPSGLSGALRRYAFRHSESQLMHWIPLVVADRVNVVEGILDDFRHGKLPNIFKEKGYKAEARHNPKGLATKALVAAAVLTVVGAYVYQRSRQRRI